MFQKTINKWSNGMEVLWEKARQAVWSSSFAIELSQIPFCSFYINCLLLYTNYRSKISLNFIAILKIWTEILLNYSKYKNS